MMESDRTYVGLPWKDGGRTRAGVDCVGIVLLFLRAETGFQPSLIESPAEEDRHKLALRCLGEAPATPWGDSATQRGDVVFFLRAKTGRLEHVAVALGGGHYLHAHAGGSRIECGLILLARAGLVPAGVISPGEAERLSLALSDPALKGPLIALPLISSLLLGAASYLLAPKVPKLSTAGRYGTGGLVTKASTQVPLADALGEVTVAGNSLYTQLPNRTAAVDNTPPQKWNKIIALGSGPFHEIDFSNMKLNGVNLADEAWFTGGNLRGFTVNPAQTKAEAVEGTIDGQSHVPSMTPYLGTYGVSVPVDIRAHYDRTFPIYGFNGVSCVILRCMNSTKINSTPNLTARIKGRLTRDFNNTGFITASGTFNGTGDGATRRFFIAQDLKSVSSVTVGGTSYAAMSASAQTGNVYYLNLTRGYIEFLTAPAGAAAIVVSYVAYSLVWTNSIPHHIVYLLNDRRRGLGLDESRFDWERIDYFRDQCEEVAAGKPALVANYVIDSRAPLIDHLRALLDAARGYIFMSGGKVVLKMPTSGELVFTFTQNEMVLKGGRSTFKLSKSNRRARPNEVKVFYHSQEGYNAETSFPLADLNDQRLRAARVGADGVVSQNLKFPAVTTAEQAKFIGGLVLRESVHARRSVEFTSNLLALEVEPGDNIAVEHPSAPQLATAATQFRVEEVKQDRLGRVVFSAVEHVGGLYDAQTL